MQIGRRLAMENLYDSLYQGSYGSLKASQGINYVPYVLRHYKFDSVLDVGCGPGYSIIEMMKNKKLANGIESCNYLLNNQLRVLVDLNVVKRGDICDIPYASDSFDVVFCTDVLEHIEEFRCLKAIGELFRVSSKYVFATVCCKDSKIDRKLHPTVKPFEWWKNLFDSYDGKQVRGTAKIGDRGGVYVYQKN